MTGFAVQGHILIIIMMFIFIICDICPIESHFKFAVNMHFFIFKTEEQIIVIWYGIWAYWTRNRVWIVPAQDYQHTRTRTHTLTHTTQHTHAECNNTVVILIRVCVSMSSCFNEEQLSICPAQICARCELKDQPLSLSIFQCFQTTTYSVDTS